MCQQTTGRTLGLYKGRHVSASQLLHVEACKSHDLAIRGNSQFPSSCRNVEIGICVNIAR
ncbi:hypothetical protein J6590_000576 [Homalodisca vitripennis]|nr:hypothetical protein J6590_000576 [Homalodisca vitripennis]